MSIQEIFYGEKATLRGIKLKVDFYNEPFISKLSEESKEFFKEALGYSLCDVYDKNKNKILTILERKKLRTFI